MCKVRVSSTAAADIVALPGCRAAVAAVAAEAADAAAPRGVASAAVARPPGRASAVASAAARGRLWRACGVVETVELATNDFTADGYVERRGCNTPRGRAVVSQHCASGASSAHGSVNSGAGSNEQGIKTEGHAASVRKTAVKQEHRKRKYEDVEDVTDAVINAKRQKKDREFHLKEMESKFQSAERCARQGNRFMLDLYVESASAHGKNTGVEVATINARVSKIQALLGNEHNYHLKEMESEFQSAERYARQGNRKMLDLYVERASKHATAVGLYIAARVAAVRNSFGLDAPTRTRAPAFKREMKAEPVAGEAARVKRSRGPVAGDGGENGSVGSADVVVERVLTVPEQSRERYERAVAAGNVVDLTAGAADRT